MTKQELLALFPGAVLVKGSLPCHPIPHFHGVCEEGLHYCPYSKYLIVTNACRFHGSDKSDPYKYREQISAMLKIYWLVKGKPFPCEGVEWWDINPGAMS